VSVSDFLARWHAFMRDDDVVCAWGHYGTNLLQREGGLLPARSLDLRKVAGDYLKRRPGSLEELVRELSLDWTPCGRGRGGERLGMLEAVARFLANEARDAGTLAISESQAELGVHQ
jgi:hypothetical protein